MLFNNLSQIIKSQKLLSINYVPEKIIGREDEIKELAFQLSYVFRDEIQLPQIMVLGGVGTGKTTTILYVLKEFEKEVKKKDINLKIVKIKGSESKTKFEILKNILIQIAPDIPPSTSSADLHTKIVKTISERGINVLVFLDEAHEIKDNEINGALYTLSRLGQDVSFSDNKSLEKIEKPKKGSVGYFLVSNDSNIRIKLKENTRSSLTRENIIFKRYTTKQIEDILRSRVEMGAIHENKIEEGVIEFISSASVKEGQDSRYALVLLSNVAKESEKRNLDNITLEIVNEVNQMLVQDYLKKLIRDLPDLHMEILLIIYDLHSLGEPINSKRIFEEYQRKTYLSQVNFSRISQIVTALEKDNIVYVTQSKKTKMRNISIEENLKEIQEILKERGKLD